MVIMRTTNQHKPVFIMGMLLMFILMMLLTSGCIHIDLGNPFKDPEEKPIDYKITTKAELKHVFDMNEDPDGKYSETEPFYIQKHTEWINISITVEINSYDILNSSLLNLSFLEQYVHVMITDPDGELFYDKKFEESVDIKSPIPPTTGPWKLQVDGKGWGDEENQDNYKIIVVVYEPK